MAVTIRELAKKSGYSIATISRALSNARTVKPETRRQIMKLADELGYPFIHHTKKDTGRSRLVMLIVGDLMNPFYLGIIKGINDTFHEQGIRLAIFNSDYDPVREEDYVRLASEPPFDGIIMITAMETSGLVSLLKKVPCPIVLANRTLRSMDLNTVCIDNYRGGYIAASFLAEEGHRKIAHLAGPVNSTASQDRMRGFKDALTDYQLDLPDKAIQYGNLKRETGVNFAKYFLIHLHGYTAVFCANDLMGSGFCDTVIEAGLSVPEDVSVMCFDDTSASVNGFVKLTTISRDPYPMGCAAAEMMIDELTDSGRKKRKIVFPPTLNIRDSVRRIERDTLTDNEVSAKNIEKGKERYTHE